MISNSRTLPRAAGAALAVVFALATSTSIACGPPPGPEYGEPSAYEAPAPQLSGDDALALAREEHPGCATPRFGRWIDHNHAALDVCGIARVYEWTPGGVVFETVGTVSIEQPGDVIDARLAIASAAEDHWGCEFPSFRALHGTSVVLDVCGAIRVYEWRDGRYVESEVTAANQTEYGERPARAPDPGYDPAPVMDGAAATHNCPRERVVFVDFGMQGGVFLDVCGTRRHYWRRPEGFVEVSDASVPAPRSIVRRTRADAVAMSAPTDQPGYSPGYAPPATSGGSVHVRGYHRRDGTYVRPHTRHRPRR